MLWIKSLHIIFMVTWMAGLLYLPRLFVYHSMSDDQIGINRFKIMERKLYFGIATPGCVLTLVFGIWLWIGYGFSGSWLAAKLALVLLLIIYHIICGKMLFQFQNDTNHRSHVFYRWFNEAPVVLLFGIVILVVVKPF